MSFRARTAIVAFVAVASLFAGCSSVAYYAQAARGQMQLLTHREPIREVLERPGTSDSLRATLELVLEVRDYASRELALPENGSYRSYVDIGRPYVVWNLFAAPEFSVEPKQFCFPLVGCLTYKGYFDEAKARAEAARLAERGNDVHVGGIAAYSTLGHFDDPFLSSMARLDPTVTAGIVFHELAHQRVYLRNDTAFNEAFATLVEEEGVRRWLGETRGPDALAAWEAQRRRQQDFAALVEATRTRLKELYAMPLAPAEMRARKAGEFERMRAEYATLKESWGGYTGYDAWFEAPLNNARLSAVATYRRLVPALRTLLAEAGGDLPAFYAKMDALGKLPAGERSRELELALARSGPAGQGA